MVTGLSALVTVKSLGAHVPRLFKVTWTLLRVT
jgi:hypothetical protein